MPEEENKKTLWDYLKDQLGINWESIERIKFAGGVVGKLTLIAVFAVLVVGLICYKAINPTISLGALLFAGCGLLAVIIILGLAYLAIIRTTDKHPDLAAIEGMDLVTLKLGLGTKELGIVPTQKAGPKPEIDITPAIEGAPRQ